MNVKRILTALMIGSVAVLVIFAGGCSAEDTGGPIAEPTESTTAAISPTAAMAVADSPGHALFIAKGCAACHGQNAEGTSIAPALPGHNEQMVKNQVRNPRFQMPTFGVDQISDGELDAIAGFITSLDGNGHQHLLTIEKTEEQAAAVEMHHWMALEALEAQDPAEAIHHVGHIIGSLDPGEHQTGMQEILALLESGVDSHEPEHQIEEMLAGSASPGLTLFQLHLRQALDSLDAEDVSGAQHHLVHAQETDDGTATTSLAEILESLEGEDHHDAEHEIQVILGLEEHND